MPRPRTWTVLALTGFAVTALAALALQMRSPTYGLEAAPRAAEAPCTRLIDHAPDTLDHRHRTDTDMRGAAVWGEGSIILRCGFTPPRPTEEFCATANGVDWVLREHDSRGSVKKLITYGRTPAVEALVDTRAAAMDVVLSELSALVKPLPTTGHTCVNEADVPPPGTASQQPSPRTKSHL